MRGEWIEIFLSAGTPLIWARLSPCGESGLKSVAVIVGGAHGASLPMRGEWIEIAPAESFRAMMRVSPHAGRVD